MVKYNKNPPRDRASQCTTIKYDKQLDKTEDVVPVRDLSHPTCVRVFNVETVETISEGSP